MRNDLSIFDKHQIKIAKQTLKMPNAMLAIIGGMTKIEASKILDKFNITHKEE